MKHAFCIALAIALLSCSTDDKESEPPSVGCGDFIEGTTRLHYGKEKAQFCDERDGRLYVRVEIGGQVWMAENLAYKAKGSRCYNDSAAYCDKYGRLYDWEQAPNVCPKGWRLPSKEDINTLVDFIGDVDAGTKLKTTSGWDDWEYQGTHNGNGTDDYGFSALPAGRFAAKKYFKFLKSSGSWQLSGHDPAYIDSKYFFYLVNMSNVMSVITQSEGSFFSVRCIKDITQ